MQTGFVFSKLADHLASLGDATASDLDLLADMPSTIAHLNSHHAILRHGDDSHQCCVVLQGYASWQDAEGASGQITSISVPGDIADLQTLYRWPDNSDLFPELGAPLQGQSHFRDDTIPVAGRPLMKQP
ncbi:hypothetical protein [Bradyrhizobium sp. DOA9]|uniref:hypothetical protein n=1 Tax=Bradyrhizobium sp. DOA9 TaxID=1126627 RepID=UPI00046ABBAD|nr:hypothetical protein [Bradyrhizobium sp. DOA9]